MTLRQIGGEFTGSKTSGIYDLNDQVLLRKASGTITRYTPEATYERFWATSEVSECSIVFSNDGTRVFVAMENGSNQVKAYSCSKPYDLSDTTYITYKSFGQASNTNLRSIRFNGDGTRIYLMYEFIIRSYDMAIPYDIDNAVINSSKDFSLVDNSLAGFIVSQSEDILYVSGNQTKKIYEYRVATAGDLDTSYLYDPLDVSAQVSAATAVALSDDGLHLYVAQGSYVYWYTLSTAWDNKTGTYQGSHNFSSIDTAITDLKMAPGGQRIIVLTDTADYIADFYLETAYNITSVAAQNKNYFLNDFSAGRLLYGHCWADNGTKLYVTWRYNTSATYIGRYDASTPYDVSTLSYAQAIDGSFGTGAQLHDIQLSADGTRLFTLDDAYNLIFQHRLSTAWDLTTYYDYRQTNILAQSSGTIYCFTYGDSGNKFYVITYANYQQQIYQYSLSTPYRIDTKTYEKSFNLTTLITDSLVYSIRWNSDGTQLLAAGSSYDRLYAIDASAAWDIGGLVWHKSKSLDAQNSDANGMEFKPDGTKLYVIDTTDKRIYQYALSTPWDTSTATLESFKDYSVLASASTAYGVTFSSDGTRVYLADSYSTADGVRNFELTTAWDITTMRVPYLEYDTPQTSQARGMTLSDDGKKMYVVDSYYDSVYEYTLSTAFDIETASYTTGQVLYVGSQEASPYGVDISSDGTKLYVVGSSADKIFQYNLSTAYDISTATYSNNFLSVSTQDSTSQSLRISSDGTKVTLVGSGSDYIRIYSLSTAWDISTGSLIKSIYVYSYDTVPTGVAVPRGPGITEGETFYVIGTSSDFLHRFNLDTAWSGSHSYVTTDRVDFKHLYTAAEECFISYGGQYLYVQDLNGLIRRFTIHTPYDTRSVDTGYYKVYSQQVTLRKVRFGDNGSKMLIAGSSSEAINVFTLNTPWIPSSAGSYLTTTGTGESPYGFSTNSDGSKYYTCGTGDTLREVSTTSNWGSSISIGPTQYIPAQQFANPTDLVFGDNGSKLYVLTTTRVYEYDCDIAYSMRDVNTKYLNIGTYETTPKFASFNSDGTEVLFAGSGGWLKKATLNSPYNLSSATGFANVISYNGVESGFSGGAFSSDGSKWFYTGTSSDRINVVNLTNYSSNASLSTSSSWTDVINPVGLCASDDGKHFVSSYSSTIYQYDLDVAWDIDSLYSRKAYQPSAIADTAPFGLYIKSDGLKVFWGGGSNDKLCSAETIYPWNFSTLINGYTTPVISETVMGGITLKPDGTAIYVAGDGLDGISRYPLSTPWDLSTIGSSDDFFGTYYNTATSGIKSISFNDDGSRVYFINSGAIRIYQYQLETEYLVGSSYGAKTSVSGFESVTRGFCFNGDGTRLYLIGDYNDKARDAQLTLPYCIATLQTLSSGTSYGTWAANAKSIASNSDGSKLYFVDSTLGSIVELNNDGAGGTVGNLSLSATLDLTNLEATPYSMFFDDGGNSFYFIGQAQDKVYRYSLNTAYDLASYDTKSFDLSNQLTGSNTIKGLAGSPERDKIYVYSSAGSIFQYNLKTNRLVSGLAYANRFIYVGTAVAGPADPVDLYMTDNGKYLSLLDRETNSVFVYALSLF